MASQQGAQGTRWCFTLNNPTDAEKTHLATVLDALPAKYAVVGREVGASGTPHLQGFVVFASNRRFRAVKQFLGGRVHLELARADSFAAAEYCKKDGDFDEYGDPPNPRGQTNVLRDLYAWNDDFVRDNGRAPTSPEIARAHPTAYIRYPRIARCLFHQGPTPEIRTGTPKEWQRELAAELELPCTDDRKIYFYCDPEGGMGKTWFQQWFFTKHPDRTQILGLGKRDDMAHSIDVSKDVFFINVPRGSMEYLQYCILEQLKDRFVQSNKYNSHVKVFQTNVHVVVFANEPPDQEKLSQDRYVIRWKV